MGLVKENFSYPSSQKNLSFGARGGRGKQKAADTVSDLDPPGQGGFSGSGQIWDVCKAGPLLLWYVPPASLEAGRRLVHGCHSWNLRLIRPLCLILLEVNLCLSLWEELTPVPFGAVAPASSLLTCKSQLQWLPHGYWMEGSDENEFPALIFTFKIGKTYSF